jgi:hypothetical protein
MSDPIERAYAPPAARTPIVSETLAFVVLALVTLLGFSQLLLERPYDNYAVFAVVGVSVVFAWLDAPRWRLDRGENMILLVLVWWLGFPLYFHNRAKRGARRLVVLAIVAVACVSVTSAWTRREMLMQKITQER